MGVFQLHVRVAGLDFGNGSSSSEAFGLSGVLVVLGRCFGLHLVVVGVGVVSVGCGVASFFSAYVWFCWTRGGGRFSLLSFFSSGCGDVCFSLVLGGGLGVDTGVRGGGVGI